MIICVFSFTDTAKRTLYQVLNLFGCWNSKEHYYKTVQRECNLVKI